MRRVGAVEAIEEGGDLEQPGAVLDEVLVDQLGRAASGHACVVVFTRQDALCADGCRALRLQCLQHVDAPDHNVPVDLVHVERLGRCR